MRIAIFYFLYIGSNGILTPFLPPYLKSLGFSMTEVSVLNSLVPALMIFVPPLWGLAADRTRRPTMLLKVACAGAAISFSFLIVAQSFVTVALVFCAFGVFATTISALADTIAVSEAKRIGTDYSRLRIWGSIGFIVASYSFAQHLSDHGSGSDVVIVSVTSTLR